MLSPRASSFDTSVKSCAKGGEPLNINGICVLLSMYVTVCIFQCLPIFATVYWNLQLLPKLVVVTACFLNLEVRGCLLVQAYIIATQIGGKKKKS